MYHRFSCNVEGQCEANPHGKYLSLRQCHAECQQQPLPRDLADLTYQYAPGSARDLAPSDQVRIIKKLTGLEVQRSDAGRVLEALDSLHEEGVGLVREPLLWPYLRTLFDPEVFQEALYDAGTFEAFAELQRTITPFYLDYKRIFLAALRQGNCSLARQIDDMPGSYIELDDEDFQELQVSPHLCVLQYLLDVYGNDYYNAYWFMEGAAQYNELETALLVLQLPDLDYDRALDAAAREGGLSFLERLALEGYYQSLVQATSFGAPFLYLALEDYDQDPDEEEVYAALGQVQDQESVDLLFSILGDPYQPTVWTVAQGLRKDLGSLTALADDELIEEARIVIASHEEQAPSVNVEDE